MPATKDNWHEGFGLDANGNVAWLTVTSSGGGTAHVKDLDTALRNVIDPATGKFRILVS